MEIILIIMLVVATVILIVDYITFKRQEKDIKRVRELMDKLFIPDEEEK